MTQQGFSRGGCCFGFLESAWHAAGASITLPAVSCPGERRRFERQRKRFFVSRALHLLCVIKVSKGSSERL